MISKLKLSTTVWILNVVCCSHRDSTGRALIGTKTLSWFVVSANFHPVFAPPVDPWLTASLGFCMTTTVVCKYMWWITVCYESIFVTSHELYVISVRTICNESRGIFVESRTMCHESLYVISQTICDESCYIRDESESRAICDQSPYVWVANHMRWVTN